MMIARPNAAAVCGTTDVRPAPSRTCRCQSSGRVMVRLSGAASLSAAAVQRCRWPAARQRLPLRRVVHAAGRSIRDGDVSFCMPRGRVTTCQAPDSGSRC